MFIGNKLFSKSPSNWAVLALVAILTTIASEVKVVPFQGEAFRFGLGSITFFMLILIWQPKSVLKAGAITGLTVVIIRTLEDVVFRDGIFVQCMINHIPAFLFYFIYALGFHLIKVERYKTMPFHLGAWAFLFEFLGNGAEQLLRHEMEKNINVDFWSWALMSGVALFRSYFVAGLIASITVSEQKKRVEEMLGVGSELYAEALYLQKSMNHIEKITASSYDLYQKLKKKEELSLSIQALKIAQEIHEVKKDSQRVLAGISKITSQKKETSLTLSELLRLVILANEKYGEFLKKAISFQLKLSSDYETEKHIPLLALLNNLAANAVESIQGKGVIKIQLYEAAGQTCFVIQDTGIGIKKEDIPILFEPGYTTKFNEKGVAATGIGLSHVKEIVQKLNGQIEVESQEIGAIFRISIPTQHLRK